MKKEAKEERRRWVASLSPGDYVVVPYLGQVHLYVVDRREKKSLLLKKVHPMPSYDEFERVGPMGSNQYIGQIQPATPEHIAKARRADLVLRITRTWWQKVPLDVLEQVVDMLDKIPKEEK